MLVALLVLVALLPALRGSELAAGRALAIPCGGSLPEEEVKDHATVKVVHRAPRAARFEVAERDESVTLSALPPRTAVAPLLPPLRPDGHNGCGAVLRC